ncbi:hypothetical protein L1887_52621 [Cichorium endivia]|nr:hypothetical protein L1887_52621 [Cichorium endivia]
MRSWLGAEKQSGCQRASNNGRAMRCRLHTRAREKMLSIGLARQRESNSSSSSSSSKAINRMPTEANSGKKKQFSKTCHVSQPERAPGSRIFSWGPARSDCSSVVAPGQCHGGSGLKGPQQLHGCSEASSSGSTSSTSSVSADPAGHPSFASFSTRHRRRRVSRARCAVDSGAYATATADALKAHPTTHPLPPTPHRRVAIAAARLSSPYPGDAAIRNLAASPSISELVTASRDPQHPPARHPPPPVPYSQQPSASFGATNTMRLANLIAWAALGALAVIFAESSFAAAALINVPALYSCEPADIACLPRATTPSKGRDSDSHKLVFRARVDKGVNLVTWDSVDLIANATAIITVTDQTTPKQTALVTASAIVQPNPSGNTTCPSSR